MPKKIIKERKENTNWCAKMKGMKAYNVKKNIKLCNYKAQTCTAKEICEAPNKLNGKGRDILCSTTHLQMNYWIIRGPACHLDKMNLRI
jgi:hypothetical protein